MTSVVAKQVVTMMCSWAATLAGQNGLSQYAPEKVSAFEAPQAYYVTREEILADPICNNDPNCKVQALHRGGVLYFDSRMDFEQLSHLSVGVHECLHYYQLKVSNQTKPGAFGKSALCGHEIDLEREALGVQQAYLVANGIYLPVTTAVSGATQCEQSADTKNEEDSKEDTVKPVGPS